MCLNNNRCTWCMYVVVCFHVCGWIRLYEPHPYARYKPALTSGTKSWISFPDRVQYIPSSDSQASTLSLKYTDLRYVLSCIEAVLSWCGCSTDRAQDLSTLELTILSRYWTVTARAAVPSVKMAAARWWTLERLFLLSVLICTLTRNASGKREVVLYYEIFYLWA